MIKPFQMAVVGDSILWGQGLPPNWKIHTLVRNYLMATLQRDVQFQLLAHSGAKIPAESGDAGAPHGPEVPNSFPSVTAQTDRVADRQNINLVLVSGGMNDLNPANVLDPKIVDLAFYKQAAKSFCGDRMQVLLPHLLDFFPRAKIVVLGYYPLISSHTSLTELPRLLGLYGLVPTVLGWALREKIAPQSVAFRDAFDQSARDVITALGTQRVSFAHAVDSNPGMSLSGVEIDGG
jgi:hypothetical protein